MAAIEVQIAASPTVEITHANVEVLTASNATIEINSTTLTTVAPGGTHDQAIHDSAGSDIGTVANPSVVADATINVNGNLLDTVVAEGTKNVDVEDTDGNDVGTIASGVVRVDNTTVRNSDSSYSDSALAESTHVIPDITFTDSDGSSSSVPAAVDIVATPAPTPAVVSLAISDTTPDFGDTITLTATALNFTGAITYHFIVRDALGSWSKVTQVSDNTYDFVVPYGGTYDIHVICEDGSGNTGSDCVSITATTINEKYTIDHDWSVETDNITIVSGQLDDITDTGETGGKDATAPAAANRPRYLQDPRFDGNGTFRSITDDRLTTSLSTLQDNVTIVGVFDWTQAEDAAGAYMVFMGGTQTTLDVGSRFNIGYLFSTMKMRFAVRQNGGGVGCFVQFSPSYGKNIFVLTYDNATGRLRVNFNGSVSTATFSGSIWNNAGNFVLLNGDGSLNYAVGWREPTSNIRIKLGTLSDTDADALYDDLLIKYPA